MALRKVTITDVVSIMSMFQRASKHSAYLKSGNVIEKSVSEDTLPPQYLCFDGTKTCRMMANLYQK